MLKLGAFFFFAPLAAIEAFYYQQFGLVVIFTLYFGLSVQAERSADRFLAKFKEAQSPDADFKERYFRARRPKEEAKKLEPETEPEFVKVQPLGGKRKAQGDARFQRAAESPRPAPRPAPVIPRAPNFHSQAPHEILAISENAATRTIVNAFRHWIKRFHPDHSPGLSPALANMQTRQITAAKKAMLARRHARKAA